MIVCHHLVSILSNAVVTWLNVGVDDAKATQSPALWCSAITCAFTNESCDLCVGCQVIREHTHIDVSV